MDKKEKELRGLVWYLDSLGVHKTPPFKGLVSFEQSRNFDIFWNIFTDAERLIFNDFSYNNRNLVKTLDYIHLKGRGVNKYDINSITLGNRLSHSMYDSFHCPCSGEKINKEKRLYWQERLMGGLLEKRRLIEGLKLKDYEQVKKDLMEDFLKNG